MQFKEEFFSTAIFVSLSIIVIELLGEFVWDSLPAVVNWLPFIVMAVLIMVACNRYFCGAQTVIGFRMTLIYGIKITMLVAIVVVAYRFTYLYLLFPDIKANTIAQARSEMAGNGGVSESELDAAADLIGRVFIPFAVAGSFISTLVSGIIGSFLGATLVVKKHNTQTP